MNSLINALVGMASPWLYVVIAGLAAAESAALVGLVVPGEAALLIGGFAASQGRVSLPVLAVVATVAAIIGDSIGYELGRHFGPRVRVARVGRWVGDERWSRAEQFIERRGDSAVLIGRWVGLLRALVPGVAGTTRMPYRRFVVWNVLGAMVWAPTVVTAGYFAGGSFRTVERWLGRASQVLVVIGVFGVALWLGARWVTDVIGGWLLGTAWLVAVVATDAVLRRRSRVQIAGLVRAGHDDPPALSPRTGLVRPVTAVAVGFGLLVAAASISMVADARFAYLPDQAVLGLWLLGALGAGAVASTIDSSPVTRGGPLALPLAVWWWFRAQGVALELELLATLVAGLVMFLAGTAVTAPRPRRSAAAGRDVRPKVRAVVASSLAMVLVGTVPAGAWYAGVRRSTPTQRQANTGGIDLSVSTHQWLATQGMTILGADGHAAVAAFLATPDPTAPEATDPVTGAPLGMPNTFAWRLLKGVNDADGVLYPQIRDHLHNHWTHRGRQYLFGPSAASNAEEAFEKAIGFWKAQDRGNAIYWLGAALHLVQDSCVPQHGWFGIGTYHSDYERWVLQNQDGLAVGSGGIYQGDFRVGGGHGGDDWSSAHPRGWADECAHRGFANLAAASHPRPKVSRPTDKQWLTAPHVAAVQGLSAGFIVFYFDTVGGP